jgi:hypothetical protein
MKKIALPLAASLLVLSFLTLNITPAQAHEEVEYGDVRLVVGWVNEPPFVGQINGVFLQATRVSNDQPINNALAQMDMNIKKGAQTKSLDFQPQEEPGVYAAEMLPTQPGQYVVVMNGTIAGQAVDGQVRIEDAEDTVRIEFPPSSAGGGVSDEVLEQLQTVITDLTAQVDQATTASEEAREAAQAATNSAGELKLAADRAYIFGMVGVGAGVAGIAIGVMALSRREKIKVNEV